MKDGLFLMVMLHTAVAAFSHDVIVMKNGDEIEAKIQEISTTEVKYKQPDNPDGPLYAVLKSDIFQIKYEDGRREMFPDAVANVQAVQENYTGGQRVATWAINSILPGVGSFVMMHDKVGGGIQLATGVLGIRQYKIITLTNK